MEVDQYEAAGTRGAALPGLPLAGRLRDVMSQDRTEQLVDQGFAAIDSGEYPRAVDIGRQLHALRDRRCFEIMGRAYWLMNRVEDAVVVLEAGVGAAPDLYILWEYLGCCYLDLNRYSEARAALQRGLQCPDASTSVAFYNVALAYKREGQPEMAMQTLQQIIEAECFIPVPVMAHLRAGILNDLQRFDEAYGVAAAAIGRMEFEPDPEAHGSDDVDWDDPEETCAGLYAERGRARWGADQDREGALEDAQTSVELFGAHDAALWLLRELDVRTSPRAQYFRILICGRWPETIDDKHWGFYRSYDVVADDLGEAMQYIRRIEPDGVRETLGIEEHHVCEPRPDGPKGVYRVAKTRHMFPLS